MKKMFFFILLLAHLKSSAQFSLGIGGGYGAARFTGTAFNSFTPSAAAALGASCQTSITLGFFAGMTIKKKISRSGDIQSGIYFYSEGSKMDISYPGEHDTAFELIKLTYLEIPVNYLFKQSFKGILFFAGPGIYVSRALQGVQSGHGTNSGSATGGYGYLISDNVRFSSIGGNLDPPAVIKPLDFGVNIIAGLSYQTFSLTIHYKHGLISVFPNDNPYRFDSKNEGIYLSLTGFFKL